MKTRIKVVENGMVKKVVEVNIPDKDHLRAQIMNPHKIIQSKKKYNRKKVKKGIDIE